MFKDTRHYHTYVREACWPWLLNEAAVMICQHQLKKPTAALRKLQSATNRTGFVE
jgi:hypothetical protein